MAAIRRPAPEDPREIRNPRDRRPRGSRLEDLQHTILVPTGGPPLRLISLVVTADTPDPVAEVFSRQAPAAEDPDDDTAPGSRPAFPFVGHSAWICMAVYQTESVAPVALYQTLIANLDPNHPMRLAQASGDLRRVMQSFRRIADIRDELTLYREVCVVNARQRWGTDGWFCRVDPQHR